MQIYCKPVLRSYFNKDVIEHCAPIQTGYPVQFSIQAIQFNVSQNTQKQADVIYTTDKEITKTIIG